MDEKRRMDSQSEVARNREGRLAVRVRLLGLQSDSASEDHGVGGSMRLNGHRTGPIRGPADRNRMTCSIYHTAIGSKRCLQQMWISVFQQAPSGINPRFAMSRIS